MKGKDIKSIVKINKPAEVVWAVFTNPILTRQLGGEYVSDWKVGSSFRWKSLEGQLITNGTIIEVEPNKLLKHKLINANDEEVAVITYSLVEEDNATVLSAHEELAIPVDDEDYTIYVEEWNSMLDAIKHVAENIQ